MTQINLKSVPDIRHDGMNEGWVFLTRIIEADARCMVMAAGSLNRVVESVAAIESPYPLEIIDIFWTPDAIADQKYLSNLFADYRVHEEWFVIEEKQVHGFYDLLDNRDYSSPSRFKNQQATLFADIIQGLYTDLSVDKDREKENPCICAVQNGTATVFNHCSSHDEYDLVFKAVEMQLKHLYKRLQPSLIPGKPELTIDSWLWKEYYSFCGGMDFILQAQQHELVKNILGGDRNV